MKSLADFLYELQADPSRHKQPMFATATGNLTAADFMKRVAQLSTELKHYSESRWLVWLPELEDCAIALFALWQAGKVPILPASFQPDLIQLMESNYDGILFNGTNKTKLSKTQLHLDTYTGVDQSTSLIRLNAEVCRLVLYTSGSTSQPKPVIKYLKQLNHEVQSLEQLWGEQCGQHAVLGTIPHHHIYGLLFRLFWPLAAGRLIITSMMPTPSELASAWKKFGYCVLVSSPTHLVRLPDLIDMPAWAERYQIIFSSGAALPEQAAEKIMQQWKHPVYEIYGSTETGGIAWRGMGQKNYPEWMPLAGVQIRSDADQVLEIISPFLPDTVPVKTGDRVAISASGSFTLLGRIDSVVKIEGKRTSLEQVEGYLLQHEWVEQAAVVVLHQPRLCLGAVVVLNSMGRAVLLKEQNAAIRELKQVLSKVLDRVLIPRRWRFVDAIPVDERGKRPLKNLLALFDTEEPIRL